MGTTLIIILVCCGVAVVLAAGAAVGYFMMSRQSGQTHTTNPQVTVAVDKSAPEPTPGPEVATLPAAMPPPVEAPAVVPLPVGALLQDPAAPPTQSGTAPDAARP